MRRVLSVLLLIAMLASALSVTFCVAAEGVDSQAESIVDNTDAIDADNAKQSVSHQEVLYFSCVYDAKSKTVSVSGTMKHDAFAQYSNSSLEIFLIPPGKTEHEVANAPDAEPLAQTSVSIKFGFHFKLSKLADRYSRYAIFLKSPDGERTLASSAQYAEVPTSFEAIKDKSAFKGVSGLASGNASVIDADTVIIPVYLDMLFTDSSNGYIYQSEHRQLFFSQGYIDELDKKINSASICGSTVYIQYLLKSDGLFATGKSDDATYIMPQLYDENSLVLLHSATDFLSSRYAASDSVGTFGFIVGKGWDAPEKYNYCNELSFEKYVELCGFYAIVVSNAARSVNSSIDIVLPFMGEGFKNDYATEEATDLFSVKPLLTELLKYFENSLSSGITFSLLMETSDVPFNITNKSISSGIDTLYRNPESEFGAGYQSDFSAFIKEIDLNYSGKLTGYIYLWTPPAELKGNALCAAYAYSYYVLLGDDSISSFAIHFDDESSNADNFKDVLYITKHIDTTQGVLVTNNLLSYFGCSSWAEVLGAPINNAKKLKSRYTVNPKFEIPQEILGSFNYFDFSKSTILDGWYKGNGCNKVKIEYSSDEKKALKAGLSMSEGRQSELVYVYEYTENMHYTPYLDFSFGINDDLQSSLYEIMVVIENDSARFETSCVISGNTTADMIMDLSEYSSFGTVKNIKIFVRALDGNPEKCTLWLYGIKGYSSQYSTQALENMIYEEREKTNDAASGNDKTVSWKNIAIAAGLVIVTGIFCTAMIFGFRKENRPND